ncbi:MAG: hypothetical protein EB103_06385 [Actinobacteria bacterium]|nr:hypothetical protein [Actinomycetota bacterium]
MARLSSAELTDGLFFDLDESLARFSAVELSDVQQVAQAMFQRERSFVAVGDIAEDLFDGIYQG